jgi:seryl-tRNA(Sec) selenium transferase
MPLACANPLGSRSMMKSQSSSDTMSSVGASIVSTPIIGMMAEILPQFVEIDDLQRKASEVIARACGSEPDGGRGTNRALGARSQIAAQNDVDAIKA